MALCEVKNQFTTITAPGVAGCVIALTIPTKTTEFIKCACLTDTEIAYFPSGIVDGGELSVDVAGFSTGAPGGAGTISITGPGGSFSSYGTVTSIAGGSYTAGQTEAPFHTVTIKIHPEPAP